MVELPDYNKITFKENPAIPLEEIVPDTCPQAVDLLYRFLVYPSRRRCSATQVSLGGPGGSLTDHSLVELISDWLFLL